jgi:hypothetical protein
MPFLPTYGTAEVMRRVHRYEDLARPQRLARRLRPHRSRRLFPIQEAGLLNGDPATGAQLHPQVVVELIKVGVNRIVPRIAEEKYVRHPTSPRVSTPTRCRKTLLEADSRQARLARIGSRFVTSSW